MKRTIAGEKSRVRALSLKLKLMPQKVEGVKKLFVVVRRDLPRNIRLCQAVHAASLVTSEAGEYFETTCNLIVYMVDGEKELLDLWLAFDDIQAFLEPDLGYEFTALAYYGFQPEVFKGLKLMS